MLKIAENCKGSVYGIKNNGNYVTGTFYTSRKIKNKENIDEWRSSRWNCKFIGECAVEAARLEDKEKIFITAGQIENTTYTNKDGEKKTWLELVIFGFITQSAKEGSDLPF